MKLSDYLVIFAVAIHFSNYLYAAIAKVALDGPLLAWIFNRTPNILLASVALNSNPLSGMPNMLDVVYYTFDRTYTLTNTCVLMSQMLCIFALRRRYLIIAFLVFFDVMHISIFVTSGIFFWKWILLNCVLVASTSRLHFGRTADWLFVCGVVLVVITPQFFSVTRLGWYDTREVNRVTIEAVVDDRRRVVLPSNFFGSHSVTFAQGRVGVGLASHFPTGSLGSAYDYSIAEAAARCATELVPASRTEADQREFEIIRSFVSGYHRFALGLADSNGRLHYDLFPHHMWSNPTMFPEALDLDLRKVVGYELVIEAICITGVPSVTAMETVSRARTLIPIDLEQ
jgi:hypothetical protein